MATFTQWLNSDAPTTWAEVGARVATTGVVAFVVLQLKEYFDAGRFDTPATAVDATLVAVGVFLLSAVQKKLKS
jgi:hypothetical protein